ncbi:MAG: UDP-3-O-(3-hydroxymyristoyl)glucosamine N-acyltransferase [Holosporales bacterium]|jgi:UDP-3-O-[3-hydroxymyristoyl] glucosamine N-acyltransferase|nr:UDP-3-O-(3-hydroxymyristoyl)glucosamine N-acyltransferase [Holosporales bacterium]
MINSKFYTQNRFFSLRDICSILGVFVPEQCNLDKNITSIAKLNEAAETDITFFHNQKYLEDLKNTKAYACILLDKFKKYLPSNVVPVVVNQPYLALALLLKEFYSIKGYDIRETFISKNASVSKKAKIGNNCHISDFVFIEDDAMIKDGTFIGPNAAILRGTEIGENSHIESNVTIGFSKIGNNAYIKTGTRIGQQGFGFYMGKEGIVDILQIGVVVIGNNTQIGANCTIDRGSIGETRIGDNVRIDNMVHIAHNVEIDSNSVIAAQTGIAGSSKIGKYCVFGGQVGIAGHIEIGNSVTIAAQSGVMRDADPNSKIAGTPAQNITNWHRQSVLLKKLLKQRISAPKGLFARIKQCLFKI